MTTAAFVTTGLLDVGQMDPLLGPLLGAPLETADLVGEKQEHRCVVRYCGGGSVLYGKAYADDNAAARAWEVLSQLRGRVAVPGPVAYIAERGLVVTSPVLGRPLDELVDGPAFAPALRQAGRWLAALHEADVELTRVLDGAHEAANAAVWAATVAEAHPDLAAGVAALADGLGPPPPGPRRLVPLHKDFHYQHVLVLEDGVGVVDLDEARMGHPAFDVAHFCAYLDLLGLRRGLDPTRWRAAFLEGYGRPVDDGACRWFTLYTRVKMAKQLATGRGPMPVPEGRQRDEQLGAVLALAQRELAG